MTAPEIDLIAAFEEVFGPRDWTEQPWNAAKEEAIAAAADGRHVRRPLVEGPRQTWRRDMRDGDYVCLDGLTWAFEPEAM